MTATQKIDLNEVRHIFTIAARLYGDIQIEVVFDEKKSTLTAYHQGEEIDQLIGKDAIMASKNVM